MRRGMPIRTFTERSSPLVSRSNVRSARTFPTLSRRIAILQFCGIRFGEEARSIRMDPPAHRGVVDPTRNGRTFFARRSERIGLVLIRLTAIVLGVAAFLFTGSTLAEEPALKAVVFVPPND